MGERATTDGFPPVTGRDGAIDHLTKLTKQGFERSPGRLLFTGEGGETWFLVNDSTGVAVVRIPDFSRGEDARRFDVATFLSGTGPERDELLRLIGTLAN